MYYIASVNLFKVYLFTGIISRLDYIKDLGVETIWLNSIYPSLIDSGYDVIDYMDVDPLFGDLNDFDNLMQEAHNRGIK